MPGCGARPPLFQGRRLSYELLRVVGVMLIVMRPWTIFVQMLSAQFLRVGAMLPGMELIVGACIAVRIGNNDLIDVEALPISGIGRSQRGQTCRQSKSKNFQANTHAMIPSCWRPSGVAHDVKRTCSF